MTFTAPLEKVWGDGVVDSSSEPCFEAPFLSSEPTTGLSHRPGRVRTSALARTGSIVPCVRLCLLPSLPRVTLTLCTCCATRALDRHTLRGRALYRRARSRSSLASTLVAQHPTHWLSPRSSGSFLHRQDALIETVTPHKWFLFTVHYMVETMGKSNP